MTPLCLLHHGISEAIQKLWFPIHAVEPLGNRLLEMLHRYPSSASTSTLSPEPPRSLFFSTLTHYLVYVYFVFLSSGCNGDESCQEGGGGELAIYPETH
jgi:hypothetical protein